MVLLKKIKITGLILLAACLIGLGTVNMTLAQPAQKDGAIGVEGTIGAPPPTRSATISVPANNSSYTNMPVTVSGLCQTGLLVKIFKNNVFGGSVLCKNGSYSLPIDLFSGRNELVARVYDDLDQAGPDSNMVVVNFPFSGTSAPNRVSLTTSFAKRGANPGQTLSWPITLAGGSGPYAVTVDWGDGKTADIISQAFAGTFNITHTYDSPGVYNVIIRVSDRDGNLAFLQLVGVANGAVGQSNSAKDEKGSTVKTVTKILWQPILIAIPMIATAFWLGKKYELTSLRRQLERGDNIR